MCGKVFRRNYPLFEELTRIINEDMDFYNLLINASVSVTIFDKVRVLLKDRLAEIFTVQNMCVDALTLNYALDFTSTGLLSIYKEWFNSDRKITLEELSNQINLIVFADWTLLWILR